MFKGLVQGFLTPVTDIIDKVVRDKDLAMKLKAAITGQLLNNEAQLGKAASAIIIAEAGSESYAARNWRPHLMYLIMWMLVFNGMIVPTIYAIWGVSIPVQEAWNAIPPDMWGLLKIGLGGYIAGRSAEKITKSITGSGIIDNLKRLKKERD